MLVMIVLALFVVLASARGEGDVFVALVPLDDGEGYSTAEPRNWGSGAVPRAAANVTFDLSDDCEAAPRRHVRWETDEELGAVRVQSGTFGGCPTIVVVPSGKTMSAALLSMEGLVCDREAGRRGGAETRLMLEGPQSRVAVAGVCELLGVYLAGSGSVVCGEGGALRDAVVTPGLLGGEEGTCSKCFSGMTSNSSSYGAIEFGGAWNVGGIVGTRFFVKNNGFGGVFGAIDTVSFPNSVVFESTTVAVMLSSAPTISDRQHVTWGSADFVGRIRVESGVPVGSILSPYYGTQGGCVVTLCQGGSLIGGGLVSDKTCLTETQTSGLSVLLASSSTGCAEEPLTQFCDFSCVPPRGSCLRSVFTSGEAFCQCSFDASGRGFAGSSCAVPLCLDACNLAGECVVNATTGWPSCVCDPGYFGDSCERSQCLNDCSGHGVCDVLSGSPVCDCAEGFVGSDCSVPKSVEGECDECINGACITTETQCVCLPAWRGKSCNIAVCPGLDVEAKVRNCNGRGTCVAGGSCSCSPLWTGAACERRAAVEEGTTSAAAVSGGPDVGLIVGLTVGLVLGCALAVVIVAVTRSQMKKKAQRMRQHLISGGTASLSQSDASLSGSVAEDFHFSTIQLSQ